jgi:dolichyl-phosphate-mannose-protein mannosyltransferase
MNPTAVHSSSFPKTEIRKSVNWAGLLLIVCMTCIFCISLSDKPFHIDDVYFLEIAKNILEHPADPFSGSVALLDDDFRIFSRTNAQPNTFAAMSHPPLISYVEAAIAVISGGFREKPLHLSFLFFPVLCAISTYFLALRFTTLPTISTLLLTTSPFFLVNSTNLMTDVPMLGLGLASLSLFISGSDQEKTSYAVAAGILAGLAMLTRYVAVGLIPLFCLYQVLHRRRWALLLWVFLPVAIIFGAWMTENQIHHGSLHPVASTRHYAEFYRNLSFSPEIMLQKFIAALSALGGTEVFIFLLWMILKFRNAKTRILYFVSLLASVALLVFRPFDFQSLRDYSGYQLASVVIFTSIGFFFFLSTLSNPVQGPDYKFLILWFVCGTLVSVILLPFGTGRYILPLFPPLMFILVSELNWNQTTKWFTGVCIGLTFALSVILAVSDYQHASAYKNFARDLKKLHPSSAIWFVGDWGCRYYLNKEGFHYLLSSDNSPEKGDLIVKAEIAGLHNPSAVLLSRCSLLEALEVNTKFPVRLMNIRAHAGFYSHGFGFLPFSFSRQPLEVFYLYQVEESRNESMRNARAPQ